MTKRRTKKEVKTWNKAKWNGFVNVRMSNEEKQVVKKNLLTEEAGLEYLMNASTAGYKCSISYSIPEDVYTASLTGMYQEKPNAGVTMSMRHRDLIVALSALKWCDDEAGFNGEWSDRFGMAGNDDW